MDQFVHLVPASSSVPGFPGYRVRASGVVIGKTGKVLTPRVVRASRSGNLPYLRVALYGPDGRSERLIHHLVLEAFVGPCPDGMEARHLNDDPQDNRLENLAWGTKAENAADRNARRTHCRQGHTLPLGGWTKNGPKRARRCNVCRREAYRAKAV